MRTAKTRAVHCSSLARLSTVVIVAAVLGPFGVLQTGEAWTHADRLLLAPLLGQPAADPTVEPAVQSMVPGPLIDPVVDLRSGPVDVPLELRIPSLRINAPVVSVGITPENVMDAPQGMAGDPVWQKVFWYRGGGIPGESGTATLAGHVDDVLGRPAVFARLSDLRSGDLIVIRDTRSGLDVRFMVAGIEEYSARHAIDPSVLAQIYGSGPVSGKGPQPAPDGLAHLTLITCTGSFVNGSYDRRLVVYATRIESHLCQFTWRDRACSASVSGSSPCCYWD